VTSYIFPAFEKQHNQRNILFLGIVLPTALSKTFALRTPLGIPNSKKILVIYKWLNLLHGND
jgi:hypothetical protein